jgi:hypothetical protein
LIDHIAYGITEAELIRGIKKGNEVIVSEWLTNGNDPNTLLAKGNTALYYSIKYDQQKILFILLQHGADPNLKVKNRPPLYWAIKNNRIRIVRFLIEFGGDLAYRDEAGLDLIMHASKLARLDIVKVLIDRGADPTGTCEKGRTSEDYAFKSNAVYVLGYLESIKKQLEYSDFRNKWVDGPHFEWETENQLNMYYHITDTVKKKSLKRERTFYIDQDIYYLSGFSGDTNIYLINKDYKQKEAVIETDVDIFAFGDIHGEFEQLIKLLINNNIIDDNYNWKFGNGHVIFLGDVFDRGEKVTETLLFIYELERKANESGGDVSLLIGNHEAMALTGDHRYIHDKYIHYERFFYKEYFKLYGANSVIGDWLRKQNTILKVNNNLFLHAGISSKVLDLQLSIDSINSVVCDYLIDHNSSLYHTSSSIIVSEYGPLWFRGYSDYYGADKKIDEKIVNNILEHYEVQRMIIGHNESTSIKASYNGRLLSIDVPLDRKGVKPQALLISKGKYIRCFIDGMQEIILEQ